MLSVPSEIQELCKQDSIKKNFRVHFPNGERTDITNANIVSESVKFTESLCSRDTFKLGLCESPSIEFETVGVGNIKGAEIECSIEIYCDGDVEGAEFKSDLGHYVYSIPYGVFYVDSCERQANMEHRKINAYGKQAQFNWRTNEFEKQLKLFGWYNNSAKWQFTLDEFFQILSAQYSYKKHKNQMVEHYEEVLRSATYIDDDYYYDITVKANYYSREPFEANEQGIVLIQVNPYNYFVEEIDTIKRRISELVPNISVSAINRLVEPTIDGIAYDSFYYHNTSTTNPITESHEPPTQSYYHKSISHPSDKLPNIVSAYVYDKSDATHNIIADIFVYLPYSITIEKSLRSSSQREQIYYLTSTPPSIKYFYQTIELSDDSLIEFVFEKSEQTKALRTTSSSSTWITRTEYKFDGNYDVQDKIEAIVELEGKLGNFGRDGVISLFTLTNNFGLYPSDTLYPDTELYPQESNGGFVTRSQYQSAWYDDELAKPYGMVEVTYKDSTTHEDTYLNLLIAEDYYDKIDAYRVYSISDNYMIKNYEFSETQINGFLENIANALKNIRYMPSKVTMKALPYLESGDVINVITKTSGFETLILNHTISGIQSLKDNIEARGE